jgi:pimeloyl-[acyl-carrier protein] synthase
MNNPSSAVWNPFHRDYKQNPSAYLRRLREQNPVHRVINGRWMLFGFDDVKFLLSNPVFKTFKLGAHLRAKNKFLAPPASLENLSEMVTKWLFLLDPPEHSALRGTVVKLWNQYRIQKYIEETVAEAVENLAAKREAEIVEDFAAYIPTKIICKILGLPFEDYEQLRRWSHYFANTFEPFESFPKLIHYSENARAVCEYMERIVAAKKKSPDDSFISNFLRENEQLEKPRAPEELISLFVMLYFAGLETSIYLIGQSVLCLIENPAQTQILREDLSLVPRAVEELVRFVSPLQYAPRIASENVTIGGREIPAGELVLGCLASANRDANVFENPDELDFRRPPRAHLGFGHGFHHCIGARLARDEMNAVLPLLLLRFSKIEFDARRAHEWDNVVIFRRLKSLPVVLS